MPDHSGKTGRDDGAAIERLRSMVRRRVGLADDAEVRVTRREDGWLVEYGLSCKTDCGHGHGYLVRGELESLRQSDLRRAGIRSSRKTSPVLARLYRFFGFWAGLSGLYASTGACPCCKTPGCPVGIISAVIIGGLLSLLLNYARSAWGGLRHLFSSLFGRAQR